MTEHLIERARRWAAPAAAWRMTTMSTPMASMLRAVSMRVSPLLVLLVFSEKSMMSAERRWAARAKEMRVRVESSEKRVTMTWPRRAGTFLTVRVEAFLKESEVLRVERSEWGGG